MRCLLSLGLGAGGIRLGNRLESIPGGTVTLIMLNNLVQKGLIQLFVYFVDCQCRKWRNVLCLVCLKFFNGTKFLLYLKSEGEGLQGEEVQSLVIN